jgi:hypothetical protein
MEINSALEGREVCDRLRKELGSIRYNRDLQKIYQNIEKMVTEVSKLEVVCRQHRSVMMLQAPLRNLNESVDRLEKLILVAKLME